MCLEEKEMVLELTHQALEYQWKSSNVYGKICKNKINVNVHRTLPPVKVKEICLIFNFVSTYFGPSMGHQVAAAPWWLPVKGANWKHPESQDSNITDR